MSAPDSSSPSRASAELAKRASEHIVDVAEARRVLECAQVDRQLRFQHLVRHYLSQILHGCKSTACSTPTCLSCQKRHASRPLRPPTQLTARALAHYLAAQDSPHRGLCPHELNVAPSSLEIEGASGTRSHQQRHGQWHHSVYPSASSLVDTRARAHSSEGTRDQAEPARQHDTSHVQERVVDAVKKRHQTRKDTKSLSQNLYDSVTMIYAYSKQLPSSISLLHVIRSSQSSLSNATTAPDAAVADPQTRSRSSSRHVTATELANGENVTTPHMNDVTHNDRQPSQLNLRAHSHSHTSPTPSELLSNGRQVHKIPYHPRDSASAVRVPLAASQASLSETPVLPLPILSITKTGKKSLEKGIPEMGRMSLPPALLPLQSAKSDSKATIPADPTLPVLSTLNCSTLETLKASVYDHRRDQLPDTFNFTVDYDSNRHFRPSTPFVNRSLFYTLSDPETLLRSFREKNKAFEKSPLPHLSSPHLTISFRDWNRHNGALIFDSLWISLKALFIPPTELHVQKSPRLTPSRKGASKGNPAEWLANGEATAPTARRYLSNAEAAHIIMVCIHALTSLVSVGWPHTWAQLRKLRAWGIVMPNATSDTNDFIHPYLNMIDELEYEPAIRLAEHLLRAIGARTCHEHVLAVIKKQEETQDHVAPPNSIVDLIVQHLVVAEDVALASKRRLTPDNNTTDDPGWTVTATFMEWLKTIIIKRWDTKAEINKWSSVGSSIMLLDKLYASSGQLNLREHMFEIPFFNEHLDSIEEPMKFLSRSEQPNTLHILQYPALFPAEYLVKYFRTINFTSMMTQYDHTTRTHQMQGLLEKFLRQPHNWLIRSHMRVSLSDYLILNVSRENPLKDALDQLWGLEKRMLLKPLKIKMGQYEGEVGADHGGVTYEFFRVVLGEAFKPDHGMFTVDPQTRMTWFQPNTLEADWKFEMVGMLFSLAVYNGVTLPVTFPLALYRSLLPETAPLRYRDVREGHLESIKDGWPDLAKGLEQLLTWTDGDVEDVFMRDYAFSYEAFGQRVDHNMEEPYIRPRNATSASPAIRPEDLLSTKTKEAKLVTNSNRESFVRDYINHLTHLSVSPALRAFEKGFSACLQSKSLELFSPRTLCSLIEGEHHISIPDLRDCARYEQGYEAIHPTILNFWRIAEQYDQQDCRHLLEFVTASDRVPVTGYDGITFHIVRVGDVELLPTSSTCFGKLYLPDYPNEQTLQKKLELAIRNSKGFGVV